MIDAFFEDKNEYGWLISMVDEKTSQEVIEKLASFEDLQKSLDYANEDLAIANHKISDLEAENKRLKEELDAK